MEEVWQALVAEAVGAAEVLSIGDGVACEARQRAWWEVWSG